MDLIERTKVIKDTRRMTCEFRRLRMLQCFVMNRNIRKRWPPFLLKEVNFFLKKSG